MWNKYCDKTGGCSYNEATRTALVFWTPWKVECGPSVSEKKEMTWTGISLSTLQSTTMEYSTVLLTVTESGVLFRQDVSY